MTYTASDLTEMYLAALWNRHDAQDPAAECTRKKMEEIEEELADLECEAEFIGMDLSDVERTFQASLSLAGEVER